MIGAGGALSLLVIVSVVLGTLQRLAVVTVVGGWVYAMLAYAAAAVGGWTAGRLAGRRGLAGGAAVGLVLAAVALWTVTWPVTGLAPAGDVAVAIDWSGAAWRMLACVVVSGLAGAVGVNPNA